MQKKVVHWDESQAVTLRPTAMQVKADREEVMLLFGTHHRSDTGEARVMVEKRMVLSPSVAKRLMIMLESVIAKYESTYGSLEEHGKAEGEEARNIIGLPPFRMRLTVERVTAFFDLLKDLRVRFAFERSIKFSRRALLGGRFLIGIKKSSIGEFEEKVLLICTRMNMPPDHMNRFRSGLDAASVVGFGIDESEKGCVVKAYLEFQGLDRRNELQPYVCNLGFKWDAAENARNVITSYIRFPSLSVEEIQGRMTGFFALNSESLDIARNLVESASRRLKGSLYYTEASEQGSARSSFDLNMYEANLLMKEAYPLFMELCKLYSLNQDEFEKLYVPVSGHVFGHLAGGIDRNGEEFLTVYFGD